MTPPIGIGFSDTKAIFEAIRDVVRSAKRRPTVEESKKIIQYCRFLDERRVFYVPYNVEVVECCLGSLSSMKDFTEQCLSEIDHGASRAAMGAILDSTRQFLDKWYGFTTTRIHQSYRRPPFPGEWEEGAEQAEFFKDLGELRSVVKTMVYALKEIETKVEAANILADDRTPP